uniref:Reverse transcriptase domain-containing protein n=1 Tax=Hucho hucho TaxID=62062 RepID=A0A4W5Q9E1_9TELE
MVDKGGVVGAVFLDLRKAFDTVNHQVLIAKLSTFNFSPSAIKWIESYLTGRTQYVSVNNHRSLVLNLRTGVPQGSILGPLLFSLYINDLPSVCPDINTLMYADDTVIYVHAKTKHLAAAKLTTAMDQITNWLNRSCLQLNVDKTVGMFFTKRQCNIVSNITISGQNISIVPQVKYLGVIIDSNLSFKAHIKKVCNRVKFSLANFRYIRNALTFNAAKLFMDAMIVSHLTYCLTSWGQTNSLSLKPLATLYKKTLKALDQKPNSLHHCIILNNHKLLSWEDVIKYKNICLVYKILHNTAPAPFNSFIIQRNNSRQITRSTTRGDLLIPFRKSTFGQLSFSVTAIQNWNSLPTTIKDIHTYSTFTIHLKNWLSDNYNCTH